MNLLLSLLVSGNTTVRMKKNSPNLKFRAFQKNVVVQIFEKYGLHRVRKYKATSVVAEESCFSLRHFPSISIAKHGKKSQRKCHVHNNTTKQPPQRKETIYECQKCNVPLCVIPCFEIYHTQKALTDSSV